MAIPEDPQGAGARESAGLPDYNQTSEHPPVESTTAEVTPSEPVSSGSDGSAPFEYLPVELSPEANPEYQTDIPGTNMVDAGSDASPEPEPAQEVSGEVVNDWSSGHSDYSVPLTPSIPPASSAGALPPPPPPEPPKDEEEDEEDGMARMSFLEHLEELRTRLLMTLAGIGVAVIVCMIFKEELWAIVFGPAGAALTALKVNPPTLRQIGPTDTFQIIWMKVPILFACFLASPWILYQVWAFISPGLYKHERRYAIPFVVSSAGLFILGGIFAYFVAFRFGLEFLLGIGIGQGIDPAISVNEYYDLFVDIMLGVGVVFEIPILLFLLTLVRIVKPGFLVRHSRYVILAIVCLAAVITPTGDVFNLAIFATPMIVLFYVGILASYILVLKREKRGFPWKKILPILLLSVAVLVGVVIFFANHYGYHFVQRWPLFVK